MKVKSVRDVRFLIYEYISDSGVPKEAEHIGFVEGLEWVDKLLKELDKGEKNA
tara:strand:+ start:987 stop:1145 length:159 start_codon:yes stop_codon:yes gene_type:complete